jgi:hypothetical protein
MLQRWTAVILYGTDDEVEALQCDPALQQWIRHWADIRRQSNTNPPSVPGLASLERMVRADHEPAAGITTPKS